MTIELRGDYAFVPVEFFWIELGLLAFLIYLVFYLLVRLGYYKGRYDSRLDIDDIIFRGGSAETLRCLIIKAATQCTNIGEKS